MTLAECLSLASILCIIIGSVRYGRWETQLARWRDKADAENRRVREEMAIATGEVYLLSDKAQKQIVTLAENDANVAKALNDLGARVSDCEHSAQILKGFK